MRISDWSSDVCSSDLSTGMFDKASSAWVRPSSQKARAKATNRPSCVRFQKRRKNRPATRKPIVSAPDRKCNNISASLIQIPDEAEKQDADRAERGPQSPEFDRNSDV